MLYKLTIGYQQFIIEGDKGITTVMETLSKARVVKHDYRHRGEEIELGNDPIKLELQAEPTLKFVSRKAKKTQSIHVNPVVLPPHPFPALPGGHKLLSREQLLLAGNS